MQTELDIPFEQLIKIVKALPAKQLKKLRHEIEHGLTEKKAKAPLEDLLLHGPTATKKQLDTITNNRKAIEQWREI